jgi:uncharacterized membrane protein (DUF4010 family)
MDSDLLIGLAVSLGLGLLVGLQREWKDSGTAGVRTFTLITLLGALLSGTGETVAPWAVSAGLLAITALLVLGNIAKMPDGTSKMGLTTEVAALLMYAVGIAAGQGHIVPAIVVGGTTAALLQWKRPIHAFIDSLGERDVRGVVQLALIGLVILPILPDKTYGPYDVLNPHRIWMMVVLIVGISLTAYLIQRSLGNRDGAVLSGLLGGLISSTATAVSYARISKTQTSGVRLAALVIMLSTAVVNIRALFEIAIVAPDLLRNSALPIVAHAIIMAWICLVLYYLSRDETTSEDVEQDPAQLRAAIFFGLLYAVVLLIVAIVKTHFGNSGLYVVAALSGLTDINAITLSTAELFGQQRLGGDAAWRIIFVAILSNLVFKAGAIAVLGSRRLAIWTGIAMGIALITGILIVLLWPDWAIHLPDISHSSDAQ